MYSEVRHMAMDAKAALLNFIIKKFFQSKNKLLNFKINLTTIHMKAIKS